MRMRANNELSGGDDDEVSPLYTSSHVSGG